MLSLFVVDKYILRCYNYEKFRRFATMIYSRITKMNQQQVSVISGYWLNLLCSE